MTILLLSDDLMLGSQVSATAKQLGHTLRTSANLDALLAQCDDPEVRQVILDLNVSNVQVDTALTQLRQACPANTKFMAFAPHVHTAKIESARRAGFDQVLTRGQFHGAMRELLVSEE